MKDATKLPFRFRKLCSDLGFKVKWLSDKSGAWMQLNVKNPMVNRCHISVEPTGISVWAVDAADGYHSLICKKKLTDANLRKLVSFYTKKPDSATYRAVA